MMKKVLFTTIAAFVLTVTQVMAAGPGNLTSDLNMQLFDGALFIMDIDGMQLRPAENFKSVSGLAPGSHHLKVIRVDDIMRPNGYVERVRTRIFDGYVHIPARSIIQAKINQSNRFKIMSAIPTNVGPACGPVRPVGHNGGHANHNVNMAACGHHGCGATCSHIIVNSHCMTAHTFGQLQATLANTTFESNRMSIAKQYIATQGVNSSQVLALMGQFVYESNKLELAKFAFAYTVDRNNFFIVNNGLTYSSSISELNNFLACQY